MEENLDNTEDIQQGEPQVDSTAIADGGDIKKQDYFETRIKKPGVTTENLFDLYGPNNFNEEFKSKEDYWKDEDIQSKFVSSFGTQAKLKFDEVYNNTVKEFSAFKLGKYQKAQTGYELIRDDLSSLRSNIIMRHTNMAGTLERGTGWSAPTKDYRENFTNIRTKFIDENGETQYKIEKYSPEKLEELEEDDSFGGLAYSDAFYNIDPNEGVDGLYYEAIYDGKIQNEATGELMDVRNDQVVSRWDIDTGMGRFDDIFKNNKLEADGVLDYAKLFVKAPMNMAVNMLDTTIQLGRAVTAGGNGLFNLFRDEDLSVDSNQFYKMLTTMGIKTKAHNTSMTREALQDGFFGSPEAFLSTVADVALQVALAGGLGRAGAGLAGIMTKGMAPKVVQQATKRASEVAVRSTLTAMAAKDSYNDALENGFTTTEASLITGGMVAALWKATEYASYIFGEYEVKILRKNIRSAMKHEQDQFLKTAFKNLTKKVADKTTGPDAGKGMKALLHAQSAVDRVFGVVVKGLPPSKWAYAARQEGMEEMTEELFQDGVKHVASAYGALINNARDARKGRYLTIFDEGYFEDAALRYATSFTAGAMGGPMGIAMMGKVDLSPVTATSSLTDILLAGNKSELVSVLDDMRSNGELGPTSLSTEYNIELDAFDPVVAGSDSESLSDMVYKTYLHDINVVDTFINQGRMGDARAMLSTDPGLVEHVNNNNTMRKDLANLMGGMLDFHQKKGISIAIYPELDGLTDLEFAERAPEVVKEIQLEVDKKAKEILEIQARIDSKKTDAEVESEETTNKKPKTEKKEKGKSVVEDDDSKLSRLKAEVELSKDVSKEDLIQLLSEYRKVRAIATGAASEFYLNQNEFFDDPILGAMHYREKEYEILGDTPLKDLLFSMRVRTMEDEKLHLLKEQNSSKAELSLLAMKDLDDSSMEGIMEHLNKKGDVLTEKALKHIVKLRDKLDFKEANILFDIKHEDSIFDKDEDGTVNEEDMNSLYREILSSDAHNKTSLEDAGFFAFLEEKGEAKKFFKQLSKGVNKAKVPRYTIEIMDEYGDPKAPEYIREKEDAVDFIDGMQKRASDELSNTNTERLNGAVNAVGTKVLKFRNNSFEAVFNLSTGNFFTPDSFERRNINSLFKDSIGGKLQKQTLLETGLSQVSDLTASSGGGVYVKNDASKIDAVLEKIKVREAVARVLNKYSTNNAQFQHYLQMLANFRRNTMAIIDFKYDPDAVPNTEIEEHPYKDYTVMSDFFTDFMFDPLLLESAHKTDPNDRTPEMETVLRHQKEALELTNDVYQTEDGFTSIGEINYVALENYLNSPEMFDNLSGTDNIDAAVTFFRSDRTAFPVPSEVIVGLEPGGTVLLNFKGMARLKIAKWLFTKAKEIISEVTDTTTAIPYLKQKEKDSKATFKSLRNFIDDDAFGAVKQYIEDNVDGYKDLITDADPDANKIAAMIIKIEKALYEIYNNKAVLQGDTSNLKYEIDKYVDVKLNNLYAMESTGSGGEGTSDASRAITVLIGALTTDFAPFYSEFRSIVEASDPLSKDRVKGRIVTAAQEFSSKYTAAYISSNAFKSRIDKITGMRDNMSGKGYIDAIYISGTAGSGKTTAVTDLGLKIGIALLRNRGALNLAVVPVAQHKKQIKNISLNVGELAKGHKGKSVTEMVDTLSKATIDKGGPEAKELADVGVIIIDEVTYIKAHKTQSDEDTPQLQELNNLIKLFNKQNPTNIHPLSLVIIGDPKQSGAIVEKGDSVFPVSLDRNLAHYLPYMDFSFRSRNSYLVDSISTVVGSINTGAENYMTKRTTRIEIDKGTKFGTTDGKLYGMQFIDEVNKGDKNLVSNEFKTLLNDEELAKNIIYNILKVQKYNNEKNPEDEAKTFNVMVVPQDLSEFKNGSTTGTTKIGLLMNNPLYAEHFDLIGYNEVGGNEANYVLAEFPDQAKGNLPGVGSITVVGTGLNTIATRAFDFVALVNREETVSIKHANESVEMPDGQVIIPSDELDSVMKESIKKQYMNIFDLAGVESNTKPGDEPIVEIPGEILTPPVDKALQKSEAVNRFVKAKSGVLNPKAVLRRAIDSKKTGGFLDIKIGNFLQTLQDMYTEDGPDVDQADFDANTLLDGFEAVNEELYNELMSLSTYVQENLNGSDGYALIDVLSYAISVHTFEGDFNTLAYTGMGSFTLASVASNLIKIITDETNLDIPRIKAIKAVGKLSTDNDGYVEAVGKLMDHRFGDYKYLIEKDSNEDNFIEDTTKDLLSFQYKISGGKLKASLDDINMSDPLVMEAIAAFKLHVGAANISTEVAKAIVQQFNKGLELTQVKIPGEAHALILELLNRYSRKSVYKALEDAAELIYRIKEKADADAKGDDDLEVKMTAFQKLRTKVGIALTIEGKKNIFNAIQEKDLELKKKIVTQPKNDFSVEAADMLALKEHWHKMFAGERGMFPSDSYGAGYYDRALDHKETLEDYKNREDNIRGAKEQYTVGVRVDEWNKPQHYGVVTTNFNADGATYTMLGGKDALNTAFNFSGEAGKSLPDSLEIRAMIGPSGMLNVFVVAVKGKQKFVVSQVNSAATDSKTKTFLESMRKAVAHNKAKQHRGYRVIDLPLEGDIRNLVKSRAGKIIESTDVGKDLNQLAELGLNIADVGFVFTKKTDSVNTKVKKSMKFGKEHEIGNVRGEMFGFYSMDNGKKIDVASLTQLVQQGATLGDNRYITNEGTNIDVQLGLIPLKLTNDMTALKKVVEAHSGVEFGEFPSHFGTALHTYILEYVNEIIGTDITADSSLLTEKHKLAFGVGTETFTQEDAAKFQEMQKDLDTYYKNHSNGESVRVAVKKVLDKMKGEDTLGFLNDIAAGYVHGRIMADRASSVKAPNHMLKRHATGTYIFAINDFLKNSSDSAISKLTEITNVSNYSPKVTAAKGANPYAAVVNNEFFNALRPLLVAKMDGVENPELLITANGNGAIARAIADLDKVDVSAKVGQNLVDARAIVQEVMPTDGTLEENVINGSNNLIGLTKQDVRNKITTLENMVEILSEDKAYAREKVAIEEALSLLHRWLNIDTIVKIEDGTNGIDRLLPDFVLDDSFNVTDLDAKKNMIKAILTSILVGYDSLSIAHTEEGIKAKKAALSELMFIFEPEDVESAIEYKNAVIEHISKTVDPEGTNGIEEVLKRCNF